MAPNFWLFESIVCKLMASLNHWLKQEASFTLKSRNILYEPLSLLGLMSPIQFLSGNLTSGLSQKTWGNFSNYISLDLLQVSDSEIWCIGRASVFGGKNTLDDSDLRTTIKNSLCCFSHFLFYFFF